MSGFLHTDWLYCEQCLWITEIIMPSFLTHNSWFFWGECKLKLWLYLDALQHVQFGIFPFLYFELTYWGNGVFILYKKLSVYFMLKLELVLYAVYVWITMRALKICRYNKEKRYILKVQTKLWYFTVNCTHCKTELKSYWLSLCSLTLIPLTAGALQFYLRIHSSLTF